MKGFCTVKSRRFNELFGWEAWTRTRIARFRIWSPANWTTSQQWCVMAWVTRVSGFVLTNPEIPATNKNEPQHFPEFGTAKIQHIQIKRLCPLRQPVRTGFSALFFAETLPIVAISPFALSSNSASPHMIRLDKKLPTQTANCRRSRSGNSHHFRRAVWSRSPHTPTVSATASRKPTYAAINSKATAADRLTIAPAIASGKPCVNNNPAYDLGRHSRTVRAHRI